MKKKINIDAKDTSFQFEAKVIFLENNDVQMDIEDNNFDLLSLYNWVRKVYELDTRRLQSKSNYRK